MTGVRRSGNRAAPKRIDNGSIFIKSRFVPRIATEFKVFFSEITVLLAMAIGATATTFSTFLMTSVSEIVRLEFWNVLAEVNSSTMLVIESLVDVGRITIRSLPISLISLLTRLEMLPVKERIRIILATPIAIPRQVKNERVRFSLMDVFASLK